MTSARKKAVGVTRLWYQDLLLRGGRQLDPRLRAGRAGAGRRAPRRGSRPRRSTRGSRSGWRGSTCCAHLPELGWTGSARTDDRGRSSRTPVRGRPRWEIERMDPSPYLEGRLDRHQARALREDAPEFLAIPSGRRVRLVYEAGRPPVLAARLQELFGWPETPRVARGRVPVLPAYPGAELTARSRSPTTSGASGRRPISRSARTYAADIPSIPGRTIPSRRSRSAINRGKSS